MKETNEKLILMALLYIVSATPAQKDLPAVLKNALGPGNEYSRKWCLVTKIEDRLTDIMVSEKLWEETHREEAAV